jgi:hypothetical protein
MLVTFNHDSVGFGKTNLMLLKIIDITVAMFKF